MSVPKVTLIRSAIKTILDDVGEHGLIGDYPYDIENIGNNNKVLLVEFGDESYEQYPASQMNCEVDVSIYIYIQGIGVLDGMQLLSDNVQKVALDDLSVGGTATEINLLSVEKGEYDQSTSDLTSAGVYPEMLVWKQNYRISYFDTRS